MLKRIVSLDCGARQLAEARDALGALSGVVAAELVMGRKAIRVWQGEELPESALTDALRGVGVHGAQID
ncbi:MAG: hypothetical protein IJE08_05920 [Clostridia bacterium]|nr:hypothetical protein [Clostridia bacterium]